MNLKIELIKKQPFEHQARLDQELKATYSKFGHHSQAQVEVVLTDNKEIQALNRQYRHKDKPTDVLSFPVSISDNQQLVVPNTEVLHLGTIVISIEQANQQIGRFGSDLASEVSGLASHGLRHLLGHTHDELGNWQ